MSTAGAVVDRVFREWLFGADDQPVRLTFDADVTAATGTWTYADATLAPDEEDLLAPGVIVEAGLEQARITAVDASADTLTVERGVNGTTATAHTSGDEMTVASTYTRRAVFDAVADNVVALYPSLWRVATETITSASTHVEVPAEVVTVQRFLYSSGSRYVDGTVELLTDFTPSATGKAVLFYGVPPSKTGYLTYRARFARPTTEATDLQTLGVDVSWERIVAVGAAAQVLAGRDLDPVTAEYITEQLEREAFPAGSAARARDSLLRYYQFLLTEAQRNLRPDSTVPVVMHW